MANNRLPYFPFWAGEYLTDPKILACNNRELGILQKLWCLMWINPIQRGHLFLKEKVPLSDSIIAANLLETLDDWLRIRRKLCEELEIIKTGSFGELYSSRMSKFVSMYKLGGKKTPKRPEDDRKVPTKKKTPKRPLYLDSDIDLDLKSDLNLKNKELNPFVELFNSTTTNLPKVEVLTDKRKAKIKTRRNQIPDLDWWKSVFEKADKVSIPGRNGKGDWKPSFDWLIENDTNAVKVYEGQYEKEKKNGERKLSQPDEPGTFGEPGFRKIPRA